MSILFNNIKGPLSVDHLETLLNLHDLNEQEFNNALKILTSSQKEQFNEFEASVAAKHYREFREKALPVINFKHLPVELDESLLNKVYEYYKISKAWKAVSSYFSIAHFSQIANKDSEIQNEEYRKKLQAMTEKEKAEDAAKWARIKNDPNPNKFYGNMGQPETPEEYKNRYGVYPPGYDQKTGKKLEE